MTVEYQFITPEDIKQDRIGVVKLLDERFVDLSEYPLTADIDIQIKHIELKER